MSRCAARPARTDATASRQRRAAGQAAASPQPLPARAAAAATARRGRPSRARSAASAAHLLLADADELVDRADAPAAELGEQDHPLDVVVLEQRDVRAHLGDRAHLAGKKAARPGPGLGGAEARRSGGRRACARVSATVSMAAAVLARLSACVARLGEPRARAWPGRRRAERNPSRGLELRAARPSGATARAPAPSRTRPPPGTSARTCGSP